MSKRKAVPSSGDAAGAEVTTLKKKTSLVREVYPRDVILPKDLPAGDYLKVISWNIPGLRSAVKNHRDIIESLLGKHRPDVLCLQETKLQESHVPEFESFFNELGYKGYWLCSIAKKGYSGTAVLVKSSMWKDYSMQPSAPKKSVQSSLSFAKVGAADSAVAGTSVLAAGTDVTVQSVRYELPDSRFAGEGRTITLEFPSFFLVACYVPNSGMDLARLTYRVEEWDPHMKQYLDSLKSTKPVIFCGDLNVGHLDLDIYNYTAKHIVKQAGLTPAERNSFSALLGAGYVDAFRHFHPDARGQFTYWSQRTAARSVNCGIRLDYFICSENLFPKSSDADSDFVQSGPQIADSYLLPDETEPCSDHCPVALVVEL